MISYPYNIILVLLQIILHRQQVITHKNKNLKYEELLENPTIDNETLIEFQHHKLVKLYSPDLCDIQLRRLKTMVIDIFEEGIPHLSSSESLNLITLANYYYAKRIQEIEETEIPELFNDIKRELK